MDSPILSPIFSPLNFENDDKTNSWIAWMNNADEANRIAKENEDLRSKMADMKRHITLLEQIVLSEDGDGPIHQIHDSLLNSAPGSVEIIGEYPLKQQQQYGAPALFEMEIPPPAHLEVDRILSGDAYEVSSIDLLDENRVMIIYNEKKDFIVENDASNIIISLWTTSAARIKLYEIMDIIVNTPGCTLIYTDTDSVIFECPEDFCPLETGNYLGELTDEVGPNEEIIEVIVGGNKQYALKIRNKITGEITYVLKLRGITLNAETSTLLHYEKFKDMVMNYDQNDYVELDYKRILPNRTGHVITKNIPKRYRVYYKKGWIKDSIVYPFGF